MNIFLALISVLGVSLLSLIGALALPISEKKFQNFLIYFISFSAGALLGDVFIHLLPEVIETEGFTQAISLYVITGILFTFIIEKVIHWKHHHTHSGHTHKHPITTMTLLGDGIHNFVDGLIIGASYLVSIPVGIATTIAVVLHEIPQEIGNFGVLVHGGYSRVRALWVNFISALFAVAGTIIALVVSTQLENSVMVLTAFAAGNFIYIAASDLIPELHKELSVRKTVMQFITMCIGIGIMFSLLYLE